MGLLPRETGLYMESDVKTYTYTAAALTIALSLATGSADAANGTITFPLDASTPARTVRFVTLRNTVAWYSEDTAVPQTDGWVFDIMRGGLCCDQTTQVLFIETSCPTMKVRSFAVGYGRSAQEVNDTLTYLWPTSTWRTVAAGTPEAIRAKEICFEKGFLSK